MSLHVQEAPSGSLGSTVLPPVGGTQSPWEGLSIERPSESVRTVPKGKGGKQPQIKGISSGGSDFGWWGA